MKVRDFLQKLLNKFETQSHDLDSKLQIEVAGKVYDFSNCFILHDSTNWPGHTRIVLTREVGEHCRPFNKTPKEFLTRIDYFSKLVQDNMKQEFIEYTRCE